MEMKWQAVVDYGEPAGHGKTLATADTLKDLLAELLLDCGRKAPSEITNLIYRMRQSDQTSINIFYAELP